MMRPLRLLVGIALAALAAPASAAGPDCGVPEELIEDEATLPLVAQALRDKRPITIVAIGGAATAGIAAADPERDSYPRRLQEALRRRHPGVPVNVLNKGISRQTTQEMVDRFERDVYAPAPMLVIWETGTFDAARNVDVEVFATALETGLGALREHKFDIMLMNMQYSRSTESVINFAPYLEAMQHRADVEEVYLFRRFEMMRYWSENGVFEFADVPRERRAELAAQVYDCLAQRLADAIEHAAR
ncbi:MAG TPA: GDSL-type esterase/lipase family protein [Stellaceae bacterium]|nr:GDSL-type esterase/lipase family protein [Stellaceae bacterium]